MALKIRIEIADDSNDEVVVQVWDKGYPQGQPDTLVNEIKLSSPCDMAGPDVDITSTRYLVIKEA